MGEAFLWGLVGGSSLVIGGVLALRLAITRRLLGLIMAFGAGVLISAVAYELVHEAFETSAGDGGIALGLLGGSAVFFAAEVLIDRLGRGKQSSSGEGHAAEAGRALVLGIVLDGIPESLVLGLTVLEAGTVSVARVRSDGGTSLRGEIEDVHRPNCRLVSDASDSAKPGG